jgi:hypothetical protein
VSIDHWKRAIDRTPPLITAPWGEQAVTDTATVFGVTLYNPWTSGEHNTPRFVDWQFSRAAVKVYGRPLSRTQYDDGNWPARDRDDVRTWLTKAAVLLTLELLILLVSELGYSRRREPGGRAATVMHWLAVLPLMAFIIADSGYRIRGATVVMPLLLRLLREAAGMLPSQTAFAVVVAAIPISAMYALLERQFRRSEPALVNVAATKGTPR